MEFQWQKIGKYLFVQFDGDAVIAESSQQTPEKIIENLKYNFERISTHEKNDGKAIEKFCMVTHARRRPDWIGYQFDGKHRKAGYEASIPIRDGLGNYQKLDIDHVTIRNGDAIYGVRWGSRPEGTIVNLLKKKQKGVAFLEDFIAEVCLRNGFVMEPDRDRLDRRLFPFTDHQIKKQFEFYPALIRIVT